METQVEVWENRKVFYNTNITLELVLVHLLHDTASRFRTKMTLCSLSNQRRPSKGQTPALKHAFNLWHSNFTPIRLLIQKTTLTVTKKKLEKTLAVIRWQMIWSGYILTLSFVLLAAQKGGVTMYIFTSKLCLTCSSDHILFACRLLARAVRLI